MKMNLQDWTGGFGDLQTMFLDTEFGKYIVRYFDDSGMDASYKYIIGFTPLPNGEILLHMVDGGYALEESFKRTGVEFATLTQVIGKHGFCIYPQDQDDDDDDEDE